MRRPVCGREKDGIQRDILRHFQENPDAEDTIEGIAEWWLLRQTLQRNISQVKGALDDLAARRFLVERKTEGSRTYYRINKRRRASIARLLAESGSWGSGSY